MASVKSKAKAIANIKKNRLHIAMSGNVDTKALENLYTEIRFCVADLKEGFEVVSDISECNFIYLTGLQTYKKITDFLISKKVGAIVRVVKSGNIIPIRFQVEPNGDIVMAWPGHEKLMMSW